MSTSSTNTPASDSTQATPADPEAQTVARPQPPVLSDLSPQPPQEREALGRGDALGRYVVLDRLARGGMGVVYAAYDPELDRRVALKLLRAPKAGKDGESDGAARMLREAQAMAKLSHPNVIAVYDVGTLGDRVFIAMELVTGKTLKQWQRERAHPWREVVEKYVAAGEGLAAAHAAGLIHRDVKPENVLIGDDGRVRVVDFGLARPADGLESISGVLTRSAESQGDQSSTGRAVLSEQLTATGTVMGTPAYMAPEQHAGHGADERSDQFSLCVALYEGLYADRPFPGKSPEQLYAAIVGGHVREPPKGTHVPAWLRRVVVRGMSHDPDARYRSIRALLTDLKRDPAAMWRRRLLGAGAVVALAAAVVGVSELRDQRAMLCSGGVDKAAAVWGTQRREAIAATFLGTGKPYAADAWDRAREIVDGYLERWTTMHVDACEATRLRAEQSEELLDLRIQCLDQRLQSVEALGDVLEGADSKVVEKAVKAAYALPSIEPCADGRALMAATPAPEDPASLAAVTTIRERLAEAGALRTAGKWKEGLEILRPLVDEAEALGYAPVEAETMLLLGKLHIDGGSTNEALELLTRASLRAEAGRDDRGRLDAYGRMVFVLGYHMHRLEDAERVAERAQALLDRIDAGPVTRADILNPMGAMYQGSGQFEKAEPLYRRALELREQNLPALHTDVAASLNNLANALMFQGRYDDAFPLATRALRVWEQGLGADHPAIASALTNRANVLGYLGRHDEAIADHERAGRLIAEAWSDDHPTLGYIYNNLGVELERTERYDEALQRFDQAHKILAPSDAQWAAQITANSGNVLLAQKQPAPALEAFERALATMERLVGGDHPDLANPLSGKGQALLALDRAREAIAPLERALRIRTKHSSSPNELAEIRFVLGKALWASGGDRRRAHELVTVSRAGYANERKRSAHKWLEQIDDWLATHKQPSKPTQAP